MLDQTTAETTATARHKQPEIIERRLVWKGGVVEIKIPTENFCRLGNFQDLWYMQFGRVISPKNIINVFLHADRPQEYCCKKIRAEIEVHLKRFADGRCYHHIDLRPTENPPSHKLRVQPGIGTARQEGLTILPLEYPQVGEILLSEFLAPDPQLARLKEAGWQIKTEDGRKVELTRMKDGKERTMTHFKPKSA
ncbi:hypothetical protein K2Q08_03050 [Patescibacteria group bacterium]|nr:hypothetical protein [Patescibacteria group bacterium]